MQAPHVQMQVGTCQMNVLGLLAISAVQAQQVAAARV
jgi:hypothetical protein